MNANFSFKEPSWKKPKCAQSFARGSEQQNVDKKESMNSLSEWKYLFVNQSDKISEQNLFKISFHTMDFRWRISFPCVFGLLRKWRKEVKICFLSFSSVAYNALLIEIPCRMHVNYKQRINECIDIRKCTGIGHKWHIGE